MSPSENIRIRYRETKSNNVFVSVQIFTSLINGALYRAEIDTENMQYRILNVRQQECVRSTEKDGPFRTISTHVLKRKVKRVLYELGVRFDFEIRQPRPDKKSKKNKLEKV